MAQRRDCLKLGLSGLLVRQSMSSSVVVSWTALFVASSTFAAAPKLTAVFPPGAARGQKVAVTASGDFSKWPVELRFDRPGLTATAASDKGKFEVQVAPDAAPGVYWLRAIDAEGASSPRPFVVGTVREMEEVEPNDQVDKAQELELPVTVNAKVGKAGDVDGFVVKLRSGERLVAAVEGNNTFASPMDAVLQVAEIIGSARTSATPPPRFARRPEAFVLEQRDDEMGLDPRLTFVAPHDGRYLVRVFAFPSEPNSSVGLAGGDNYVYRLTLAAGGGRRGARGRRSRHFLGVSVGRRGRLSARMDESCQPRRDARGLDAHGTGTAVAGDREWSIGSTGPASGLPFSSSEGAEAACTSGRSFARISARRAPLDPGCGREDTRRERRREQPTRPRARF